MDQAIIDKRKTVL